MKIDNRKYPYRGIISEIAKEENKSASSVLMSFRRKNPVIVKKFNDLLEVRLIENQRLIDQVSGVTQNR